ncbi:hypothetical protein AKJ09_04982 [Labilithrix luteola]|uniref:Uncharacterized protein n=1 Tax=Labilithrix luteola TaxID=1391654 RepID=A0A0K1PXS0_9BACT|nr:hypothetical protein AKJ09_04982 [Labilithrix luteola]
MPTTTAPSADPLYSLSRGVRLSHSKGAHLVGLGNIDERRRFLAAVRERV